MERARGPETRLTRRPGSRLWNRVAPRHRPPYILPPIPPRPVRSSRRVYGPRDSDRVVSLDGHWQRKGRRWRSFASLGVLIPLLPAFLQASTGKNRFPGWILPGRKGEEGIALREGPGQILCWADPSTRHY